MNCSEHEPDYYAPLPGRVKRLIGIGVALAWVVLLLAGCRHRLVGIEPVTVKPTLLMPYTRPTSGTYVYGTTVRFAVDSLPTGATLEYSLDNGQHWQAADSLLLQTAINLQLRSRFGQYVSVSSAAAYVVCFRRVMLVGNSITLHAPESDIGWSGNWGMAASAPANDYAHKLTEQLRSLDSQVVVKIYDAIPFERQFWTFDYSTVRSVAAFKPDLVVMRIGENVPVASITSHNFKQYYQRLIDSLTVNYAPVKIVCTTSFFDQLATSDIIRQVASDRKLYLADFYGLVNNRSYQAYGQFKDVGVASHPNDNGMQAITNLIWNKVH